MSEQPEQPATALPTTMRAAQVVSYGLEKENITVAEVPVPTIKASEVRLLPLYITRFGIGRSLTNNMDVEKVAMQVT